GNRKDGKRPSRKNDAGKSCDQNSLEAGFGADPAADHLTRQKDGEEGCDQTSRQNLRQHAAEESEIVPRHVVEAITTIAQINVDRGSDNDEQDHCRRPVEGRAARLRRFGGLVVHESRSTALRASAAIRGKSFWAITSRGATQEPPTANTFGKAR